jgi:hypothetical protein
LQKVRETLTSDSKVGRWGSYDPTSVSSCSHRDGEHKLELLTFWPINIHNSGGRVDDAAAIFDADVLTLTAFRTLQDSPASLSWSDCPDGSTRRRFVGGLGRGCNAPLDGPSPPSEAGAVEFSVEVSSIVAGRFRFRILEGAGETVERGLEEIRGGERRQEEARR